MFAELLSETVGAQEPPTENAREDIESNLHDLLRKRVLAAYTECGENISKAARRLGVSRNMIYRALQNRSH